jgi:hypothetical protein
MKSITFKLFSILTFSLIVTCSYAQDKREKGIVQHHERTELKRTELKSVNIENKKSSPDGEKEIIQTISNKPHATDVSTQKISVGVQNLPKEKSQPVELSKEQKILSLQSRINSVESKIATLEDDKEMNKEEIAEKTNILNSLKTELTILQK